MPTYDYRCERCLIEFELSRPISERNNEAKCPACKGAAKKSWGKTPPGISFKGKGWTEKGLPGTAKKVDLE